MNFLSWFIFTLFQFFFNLSYNSFFIYWNCQTLANCRSEVCKALGIPEEQCELSMGMSSDFELAVRTICILPLSNFGCVYNLPLKYRTMLVPLVASYAQSHAMFTQTWMCLKYEYAQFFISFSCILRVLWGHIFIVMSGYGQEYLRIKSGNMEEGKPHSSSIQ